MKTILRSVKLDNLEPGDKIFADGSFTCMSEGEKEVFQAEQGLAVTCDEGDHYLDGQLEPDGTLVGFYLKSELPDVFLEDEWIAEVTNEIIRMNNSASRPQLRAAIRCLLDERKYIRETLARLLPSDVRGICLDAKCKATIGDLIGRRSDE